MYKKRNRFLIYIIAILMALTMSIAFVACKKAEEKPIAKTVEIKTAEDFKNLANNLGNKYSLYTYEIKNDIDLGESWKAISTNCDEPFMGKINGNNKTIKYRINEFAENKLLIESEMEDASHYGLIGCAKDVSISNLHIVANITVGVNAIQNYVGGVVSFGYKNVSLNNITLEGNVEIKMSKTNLDDYVNYSYLTNQYIGGAIGYAYEEISLNSVKSSIAITSIPFVDSEGKMHVFDKCFAGGLAGYIRPIEINEKKYSKVLNSKYEGNILVSAQNVYAGSAIGSSELVSIDGFIADSTIESNSISRLNIGGAVGAASYTKILNNNVNVKLNNEVIDISDFKEAANIGGLAGQLTKDSIVDNCMVNSEIGIGLAQYITGGLIGQIMNSTVSNTVVSGFLKVKKTESSDEYIALSDYVFKSYDKLSNYDKDVLKSIKGSSGLFGKILYRVKVSSIVTTHKSFKTISSSEYQNILTESISGDLKTHMTINKKCDPYDDYIFNSVAQTQTKKQKEDGVTSYLVTFKINQDIDSINYAVANSSLNRIVTSVSNDKIPQLIGSTQDFGVVVPVGVGGYQFLLGKATTNEELILKYDALKSKIEKNMQ